MFIFRSMCGGNRQYCDASLLRGWRNCQQRGKNDVLQYRYIKHIMHFDYKVNTLPICVSNFQQIESTSAMGPTLP